MGVSRVRFLGRLAFRNALRHKGQTVRAILGLLVATVILTAGLGLGESVSASFEETAVARFGPIDATLRAQEPFDAALADTLPQRAGLQGVEGAGTLQVQGVVSNPSAGLAEPMASLRGVSEREAQTLGPLRLADGSGSAPEPRQGEVVLSEDLASAIGTRLGETVILRAPRSGGPSEPKWETKNATGTAGVPTLGPEAHSFVVRENAMGVRALVEWLGNPGAVRATLRSPGGVEFSNESSTTPLNLVVPAPVESGTWTLTITSPTPTNYSARAGVVYPSASSENGMVAIEARVSAIVESEGRAGITSRPAAILPLEDLQQALGIPGKVNTAYYRVESDPREAVEQLAAALPSDARDRFRLTADKADAIDDASGEGMVLGTLIIAMGSFTLLAAALLAFTLFSALVEARRAEIGISRALGLTRGEVALTMVMEGALYAFAAAVAGLVLGLALVWAVMRGLGLPIVDAGNLQTQVSLGTMAAALAVGTLFPLLTIGFASLNFARLDPARAIRGIPDDPKADRRRGLVFAGALVALGAFLSISAGARVLGIPLILAGLALGLSAKKRTRLAGGAAAAGVGHIVWTLYAVDGGEVSDGLLMFVRGMMLALGLAALAVSSKAPYEALLNRVSRYRSMKRSALIGVRYLLARRGPVGRTMATISLVVLVVTILGMLLTGVTYAFTQNISGGYDVIGSSSARHEDFPSPLPSDVSASIASSDFLPSHGSFRPVNLTRNGEPLPFGERLQAFLGVTPGFVERNGFTLRRAPGFDTDKAAWTAVERGDAIMVPLFAIEPGRLQLGERIQLETATTGPREYVVAGAIQSQAFDQQTFLAVSHVHAMGYPQETKVFIRVADGADPNTLTRRLADVYAEQGLTFMSVPEENARLQDRLQLMVLAVEAFLALGLAVGLTGTGFLASRAVHERMRDIGTLRALGYEESDVRGAFILESTLTAAVGLLIGVFTGLLVGHSIWWRMLRDHGVPFQPPWLMLLGISIAVLGIAALAARGPARRASKLPPATAVRHVE